jgi:hypothetical protein
MQIREVRGWIPGEKTIVLTMVGNHRERECSHLLVAPCAMTDIQVQEPLRSWLLARLPSL